MSRNHTVKKIAAAEKILGYSFKNKVLIAHALTHPSAVEGEPVSNSYERLEFLGDSVLGAIVANELFHMFPNMDEGGLTRLKISLVSGQMLSAVSAELGVGECIIFGESEHGTHDRGMHSALENVYESLVGALYLDGGIECAHAFIMRTLSGHISEDLASRPQNPKSYLQEIVQRDYGCAPEYKIVGTDGPAHAPEFTAVVLIDNVRYGRGKGSTKKEAESAAAHEALERLSAEKNTGPAAKKGGGVVS